MNITFHIIGLYKLIKNNNETFKNNFKSSNLYNLIPDIPYRSCDRVQAIKKKRSTAFNRFTDNFKLSGIKLREYRRKGKGGIA